MTCLGVNNEHRKVAVPGGGTLVSLEAAVIAPGRANGQKKAKCQ